ncbi:MAG TPA: hypothetical protein PKD17_10680 [Cellvibrionaceae bacterium]|nr:hypothetical protein [Cellvibrionaceae bacterium]
MNSLYQVKAPKFRSRKVFVAYAERVNTMKNSHGRPEKNKSFLNVFLSAESFSSGKFSDAILTWNELLLHEYLMQSAEIMKGVNLDLGHLRNSVFSEGLCLQIYYLSWELEKVESELRHPGNPYRPFGPGLSQFGNHICLAATFCNYKYFVNIVKTTLDHIDSGHITQLPYAFVTQQFILRLAEHFLRIPRRNWEADKGNWAFDPLAREPLFQALWDHWADEGTAILEPLLMQLLNWHTYQASRENKDGGQDYYPYVEQIPLAYLFILRLRQWRGLSVPKISHVLTQPPFDSLPDEVEGRYEFCPFAKEFYAKTISLMPDFIDRLNRIKIRDWEMII